MPKTLLLALAFVVLVIVLFAADRAIKAYIQSRRRRAMEGRLASAQAKAEAKLEQQRQAAAAREALTSVMPGIHMHKPRHVNEPSLPSSSNAGPHDRRVA